MVIIQLGTGIRYLKVSQVMVHDIRDYSQCTEYLFVFGKLWAS
jgi:hypothetical protein